MTYCNLLRPTTTYCDLLQSTTTNCDLLRLTATYYNLLRPTTTCYDLLRPAVTYCDLNSVPSGIGRMGKRKRLARAARKRQKASVQAFGRDMGGVDEAVKGHKI